MADSRFVYVTYIRTTPEKLWQALIDPEFTRQYWGETWQDSEWRPGSPWRLMIPDGRVGDSGEILEIEPGRRLVLTWRNEFKPELREEGPSRLTYELEPQGEMVKLTLIHEMERPGSKLIDAVSQGWPMILASLKSLLETGESLEETRRWPEGVCRPPLRDRRRASDGPRRLRAQLGESRRTRTSARAARSCPGPSTGACP